MTITLNRPTQSTVTPAPNGLSVLLRFPRLGLENLSVTFANLDAWLTQNSRCTMIVLADMPLSFLFWRRLNRIRRAHGIAVVIQPPKL